MVTACELCVCATYTELTGTSLAATVSVVTSTGGLAASFFSSLPQPATRKSDAMSAEASAQPQARPAESNAIELPMSAEEIQAMPQQGSASTEPAVGKMLQTNARALIQGQQEAVRSEFGLSLEAEELDGDVIVLTFRG